VQAFVIITAMINDQEPTIRRGTTGVEMEVEMAGGEESSGHEAM
jgi:hypothetical protein